MSRERLLLVASMLIVLSTGLSFAGEDVALVSGVSFCLSPPPGAVPIWGNAVVDLVIRNSRSTPVWVLDPKTDTTGPPPLCRPHSSGDVAPRGWKEVKPGATWYTGWNVGSVWGSSLAFVGEHTLTMSSGLDLGGDYKAEHDVALSVTYRVIEPPAEVLTIAQERGVEAELCRADASGGTRVKAVAIPWEELENEHRAAVRESLALPTPAITPEEVAKRGGRLPMPNDPDDRKRFEEALKSDPTYLRWEALRAKMGLYAGFDYNAVLRGVRSLLVRRGRFSEDAFEAQWGSGLERRAKLGGMRQCHAIQLVCRVYLEQGKLAALEYLDALAKEDLRCADRAFLDEVRAIVLAASAELKRSDVVYAKGAEGGK